MIELSIPEFNDNLVLKHIVLDYNGTIACDGKLLPKVVKLLNRLSEQLSIHIITADTFGNVHEQLKELPYALEILPSEKQAYHKLEFVLKLNPDHVVSIGNGRNDQLMLKSSALGIAVIGEEGASYTTFLAADIICNSTLDAINLLLNPKRIVATLRN
jgi:soluble P-type ATPase